MNLMMEKIMPTPDESRGLAERIATDVNALVARLVNLKSNVEVLLNLAQGVSMTVDAAIPAPVPATSGTLDAVVSIGSPSEAA
ncbi:hypothetical protein [Nocardia sp. NPDC052566]|uniref:hypothetical protein n=1 Tax=Nocardia sp. NPDC052566 TaxID=3364330 RepID=UPI0037C68AA3